MTAVILNTNFIKRESKIGQPQVSNGDLPDWEPTVITTTPCSTYNMKGSHEPVFKVLEQSRKPFTSLKLCKCSKNPHSAFRVASNSNKKPMTICLIIYKRTLHTHTKSRHPAHRCCVVLRGMKSRNKEWNSSTRQIGLTLAINCRVIATSRSGILAKAINAVHLISIEQWKGEGNTLYTDPSNNQGNFIR